MLKGTAFEAQGLFSKNQTGMYGCRFCGRVEPKPLAICPDCGTWGSPFSDQSYQLITDTTNFLIKQI